MQYTKHSLKRTALASAMAITLGTAAISDEAYAVEMTFSYSGWFTLITPGGTGVFNNADAKAQAFYGNRTAVSGTITFDTTSGFGGTGGPTTGTMLPFSFGGSDFAIATNISFDGIGDGNNNAGSLVLGNLGFNWSGNNGIPVSLTLDADGMFNAVGTGVNIGDRIDQTATTGLKCGTGGSADIDCALSASENFLFGAKGSYTLPLGPSPMVSTTFNTTAIGTVVLGTNPSGTLPLIADTVPGSPMLTAPFPGFFANFDFTSIRLQNDGGGGDITAPAAIDQDEGSNVLPPNVPVDLGIPTDLAPGGATAEYCLHDPADLTTLDACIAAGPWVVDGTNGVNNPVTITTPATVTKAAAVWRSNSAGTVAIDDQTITITIVEGIPPTITNTPVDVNVSVDSTSEEVCFSGNGVDDSNDFTATDNIAIAALEYSLNGITFFTSKNDGTGTQDCSTNAAGEGIAFGPNDNTVTWRATDTSGNEATSTQTVTLNLPAGITGKACEVNLDYTGDRNLLGEFVMLNPQGAQVGTTDTGVTGEIDTTILCTDPVCDDVGASLNSGQPFQGLTWFTNPITLFEEGDWSFNACPGDNSTQCDGPPQPRLLDMTVLSAAANGGVPQLGVHMLFEWGSTKDIDVVVVWDVNCDTKQLTTTDPDGDGILGTKMVDGPFIGFNAAFNVSATGIDPDGDQVPLVADGGYVVDIPASRNPVALNSPLVLDSTSKEAADFSSDSSSVRSCVGGCFDFTVEAGGLIEATDADGDYKFVQVALPLDAPIPFWSVYRKYNEASGTWSPFVVNTRNRVKSAPVDENGACPEPGSGGYTISVNSLLADKLGDGDRCIELTIENNGPNDSDPDLTRVVDPGGVSEVPNPPKPNAETSGDNFGSGACSISNQPVDPLQRSEWWLLGGLLAWLGFSSRRNKRSDQKS